MTQFKAGDKVTPVVAERYAIHTIELMKQLVGKPLLVRSVHSYKNGDEIVLAGVPGAEEWFWLADDLRLVTAWSNEPIQNEPTKTAAQNPPRVGETNRVDSTCEKDQVVEVKVQSASKHTPGPWKAHFDETYFVTGIDGGRVAIATHLKGPYGIGGRRSAEEAAANCRLIAAAPDLLKQRDELLVELKATESRLHEVSVFCATVWQQRDELLDALKDMLEQFNHDSVHNESEVIAKAKAAIALVGEDTQAKCKCDFRQQHQPTSQII